MSNKFLTLPKLILITLKTGKTKTRYVAILTLIFGLILIGCNKESDIIGLNIQPPSDLLNAHFFDSTNIVTYSVLDDSLRTDKLSQNVIGFLNNTEIGNTQAGVAFHLFPSSRNVKFGENASLDSAFLIIAIRAFMGDTLAPVNFGLYEIIDPIFADSNYYPNSSVNYLKNNLISGSSNFTIKPTTVTIENNVAITPHIKIPLNKSWVENKIMAKSNQPELYDNESFVQYLKGLYLIAQSATKGGYVTSVDLKASMSGLVLHYKNDEKDSLTYTFVVGDKAARFSTFNHFDFTHASSHFKQQVLMNDTNLGSEKVYLKALAGTNVRIHFPNIRETFKNQRVIINKAELVLSPYDNVSGNYFVPSKITLSKVKSDGGYQFLPDDAIFEGEQYFGGEFNTTNQEYRFRITKYIQNLIQNNEPDYGLSLFITGRAVRGNSVVLTGNNPTNPSVGSKRMRLEITYSLLN